MDFFVTWLFGFALSSVFFMELLADVMFFGLVVLDLVNCFVYF